MNNIDMNQNTQRINIRPEDTKLVKCKECDGSVFVEGFEIRSISAIISPTGNEEIFKVPVPICANCGTVLEGE